MRCREARRESREGVREFKDTFLTGLECASCKARLSDTDEVDEHWKGTGHVKYIRKTVLIVDE
jgi:hypothetical protein